MFNTASANIRRRPVIAAIALASVILLASLFWPTSLQPSSFVPHSPEPPSDYLEDARPVFADIETPKTAWQRPTLESTESKYAFVSLLAEDKSQGLSDVDTDGDHHFVAMRILVYQMLHCPTTKTNGIPLIILAVQGASEVKKERLRRDGAIVIDIEPIPIPDWMPEALTSAWTSMFDKLRVWELTQFERVAYLDADTLITKPLDGVFESVTLQQKNSEIEPDAVWATPPDEYIFAAGIEPTISHNFPPTLEQGDYERGEYVNAGFFVTKPSKEMMNYYRAAMAIPNSFETNLREQDLLNYVHRLTGQMPWQQLDPIWNMHYPMQSDIDGGTHSIHVKWWNPHHRDLLPYLHSWRWRMAGFFAAWDEEHE